MQWIALFKKEIDESWHNKKLVWVPLVFILLTIMDPITYYYLPEILEHTGGVPEGTIFEIPEMRAEDVVMLSLEQLGMFGTLLVGFITMGTIAGERKSGTMEMMLAKPIRMNHFITSKWAANALLLIGALTIGLAFSMYYISILFTTLNISTIIGVIAFYSIWLLFVLSISIFYNSFIRSPGAVLGCTIFTIMVLSTIKTVFGHKLTMLPNQMANHIGAFIEDKHVHTELMGTSAITLCAIIILVIASIILFKKSEMVN